MSEADCTTELDRGHQVHPASDALTFEVGRTVMAIPWDTAGCLDRVLQSVRRSSGQNAPPSPWRSRAGARAVMSDGCWLVVPGDVAIV